jgi:hypothetical protein
MNVSHASQNATWARRSEFHVLPYAEEGFAPLNIHTRDSTLSKDQLVQFAALVNDRNEVGSLYPSAAVSAVSRLVVRDLQDAQVLRQSIEEFFQANARTTRAKKVLIDFRAPGVPKFVTVAIHEAVACSDASIVEEVVVVDDSAP